MKSIYSCRKKSQKKRKSKGHHHLLQVLGLRLHHLLAMFHSRGANTSLWHWLNNTSKKSPDQMAFQISTPFSRLNNYLRISLVAQWWRIHEPMQGASVQSLIQEDPTCHRAAKPVCHNHWAYALEPQLLSPHATTTKTHGPEPMLCNRRSHHLEKPTYCNQRVGLAHCN